MVEQLAFTEVLPSMEYKQVKSTVIKMLKRYKKLPHMIAAAERRAEGRGIHKSEYLKDEDGIEYLAKAGQAFTGDYRREQMHQEKALRIFHKAYQENPESEALDEINGILVGVRPWGYDGALGRNYRVISAQKAWDEVHKLQEELDAIEFALERLKAYAPLLEQLLRLKYIEDYKVWQVAKELGFSPKTYDRWKDEAIAEFAMLAGITDS